MQEMCDALYQMSMDLGVEEIRNIMQWNSLDWGESMNYTEFIAATLNVKKELNKELLWAAF